MKLMELLEQGKKAARNGFESCIIVDGDKIKLMDIETNEFFDCKLSLLDLTRNDWYEYDEYKTNFEFEEGMDDAYIIDNAEIYPLPCLKQNHYEGYIKNFNAFPNKELAEFIQKKQLLERKLIVFSYLNGASEIDWSNGDNIYCIYCTMDNNKDFFIEWAYTGTKNEFNCVYFKDRKTCNKAIDLYRDEIKEFMEMKMKLGL